MYKLSTKKNKIILIKRQTKVNTNYTDIYFIKVIYFFNKQLIHIMNNE